MGKQARLKALRRQERLDVIPADPVVRGEPLRILRGIHKTIQANCSESGRKCWEYLLEMFAHCLGWQTDTCDAKHLWDKMQNETRWVEFMQAWNAEVELAKRNGGPFSEPLGQLLEEIEGTNSHLGQFFTPMSVVRMMNALTLQADDEDESNQGNGWPTRRCLDPCLGTGRFMIDALVHDDRLVMHGVDLDLWLLRCAMLNVRLLARWTSLHLENPGDLLKPLRTPLERVANQHKDPGGGLLVIGGRSIFMHGDALVVDLNYTPNWTCAGWHWLPQPWQSNLKIDGYYGSYNEWVADGRPPLHQPPGGEQVQFDYSMKDRQPARVAP